MDKDLKQLTAEQLGGLLFSIHDHLNEGQIIYHEEDIIKLFTKLGYPEPVWGISLNIDDL